MDLAALSDRVRVELPDVRVVYLFGSASRGESRPDSDVDLAVLLARKLDPVERWELQERLAAALGRDVDLVDLRAASTVMKAQIIVDGRILYEADATERALFEVAQLAAYAHLQEERRGILEDIRARGHIYG